MYEAFLFINDKNLLKVLEAEDNPKKDRSSWQIDKNKILITAKDIIAFKATVNGLIKLIEAYEKTLKVIKQ